MVQKQLAGAKCQQTITEFWLNYKASNIDVTAKRLKVQKNRFFPHVSSSPAWKSSAVCVEL